MTLKRKNAREAKVVSLPSPFVSILQFGPLGGTKGPVLRLSWLAPSPVAATNMALPGRRRKKPEQTHGRNKVSSRST